MIRQRLTLEELFIMTQTIMRIVKIDNPINIQA